MNGPHPRRFRFGVLAKAPRSRAAWAELARRAEGLGYATLCLPDHFNVQLAPFPALVAAADATTGLRVGTLVANNDFRHPVLLAREAATVDLLSDGRFELGVGCGWKRRDYDLSGVQWQRGRVRVERFREALEIITRLLAGETVTQAGRWYRVQGVEGNPAAVRQPPPLLVGAGGPRMLELAAHHASIVSLSRSMAAGPNRADAARDGTAEAVDAKIAAVRAAAGDRFEALELHLLVTLLDVGDGPSETARAFASSSGLTVAEVVDSPQHLAGSVEGIAETLHARRERFGLSYLSVDEGSLDAFAPVVARLAGG